MKRWKIQRLCDTEELSRCCTHKNLMSAQPSGLSPSSTSLRQTTRLPNNCSYWSSGKTTEWAIMDQSDRYTVCVCVCLCECTALNVRQPKSFTAGALKSTVQGILFFFQTKRCGLEWHPVLWRLSSEQPQADSGQVVANSQCHARTWPMKEGEPCHLGHQLKKRGCNSVIINIWTNRESAVGGYVLKTHVTAWNTGHRCLLRRALLLKLNWLHD